METPDGALCFSHCRSSVRQNQTVWGGLPQLGGKENVGSCSFVCLQLLLRDFIDQLLHWERSRKRPSAASVALFFVSFVFQLSAQSTSLSRVLRRLSVPELTNVELTETQTDFTCCHSQSHDVSHDHQRPVAWTHSRGNRVPAAAWGMCSFPPGCFWKVQEKRVCACVLFTSATAESGCSQTFCFILTRRNLPTTMFYSNPERFCPLLDAHNMKQSQWSGQITTKRSPPK